MSPRKFVDAPEWLGYNAEYITRTTWRDVHMPQAVEPAIETFARIKVVGIGGAGGAAVNRMVEAGIEGVEYIAINTDAQALHNSKADVKLHIGKDTTRG